jgi:hypothetical protein
MFTEQMSKQMARMVRDKEITAMRKVSRQASGAVWGRKQQRSLLCKHHLQPIALHSECSSCFVGFCVF